MAKCTVCNEDMNKVNGCNNHEYVLNDGTLVKPVKVGDANDWYFGDETGARCGDCNASTGETHHAFCDVERCSICGGQFITCNCDYSDRIIIHVTSLPVAMYTPKDRYLIPVSRIYDLQDEKKL